MDRLNVLIWHIHGSYLNTLARVGHNWYVPTKLGKPEGYGGRGPTFDLPDNVIEVPADRVRLLDLDLVVFQTPKNYFEDSFEILTPRQLELPQIYLEHNTPRLDPVSQLHPAAKAARRDGTDPLLIHVTQFNRLMWNSESLPTRVIEHSVAISAGVKYDGRLARGITVINGMAKRPRVAGLDIFLGARDRVPLDSVGMGTELLGGHGDVPYRDLHALVAKYRFLFSPIRYTSLPLAVVEAMTIGMPVVALATTELPTVIENGVSGFVSCNVEELIEAMERLLSDPALARRIGDNARLVAESRFGLERFSKDWVGACRGALEQRIDRVMPETERKLDAVAT